MWFNIYEVNRSRCRKSPALLNRADYLVYLVTSLLIAIKQIRGNWLQPCIWAVCLRCWSKVRLHCGRRSNPPVIVGDGDSTSDPVVHKLFACLVVANVLNNRYNFPFVLSPDGTKHVREIANFTAHGAKEARLVHTPVTIEQCLNTKPQGKTASLHTSICFYKLAFVGRGDKRRIYSLVVLGICREESFPNNRSAPTTPARAHTMIHAYGASSMIDHPDAYAPTRNAIIDIASEAMMNFMSVLFPSQAAATARLHRTTCSCGRHLRHPCGSSSQAAQTWTVRLRASVRPRSR